MKQCKCGKNNWEWQLNPNLESWIRCKDCKDSMFDKGIGVILINWNTTNINEVSIDEVLFCNKYNKGILGANNA